MTEHQPRSEEFVCLFPFCPFTASDHREVLEHERAAHPEFMSDVDHVFARLEVGWTSEEWRAWRALGEAALLLMGLPREHPHELEETSHAIHQLQRGLMARPTRRRLQELGEATPSEGSREGRSQDPGEIGTKAVLERERPRGD